jgi:hypothetical protein
LTETVEHLRRFSKRIAAERGKLRFLGLFLRADSSDLWDLVIAAPWWLAGTTPNNVIDAAQELAKDLSQDDFLKLSRIYILGGRPVIFSTSLTSGSIGEHTNFVFNGVPISRGYIIVTNPRAPKGRRGRLGRARR